MYSEQEKIFFHQVPVDSSVDKISCYFRSCCYHNKYEIIQICTKHLNIETSCTDYERFYIEKYFPQCDLKTKTEICKILEEPSWISIGKDPNLTEDFIIKYIEKPWVWEELAQNPVLTPEIVLTFWDLIRDNWEWNYLTLNPHVTIDMVVYQPNFLEMDWAIFSLHRNKNITPEIIEQYEHIIDWNWEYMYQNPNLTIPFIEQNIDKLAHYRIIGSIIELKLEGFDLDFVKRHADDFIWDYIDDTAEYLKIKPSELLEIINKHRTQ